MPLTCVIWAYIVRQWPLSHQSGYSSDLRPPPPTAAVWPKRLCGGRTATLCRKRRWGPRDCVAITLVQQQVQRRTREVASDMATLGR